MKYGVGRSSVWRSKRYVDIKPSITVGELGAWKTSLGRNWLSKTHKLLVLNITGVGLG